MMTPEQHRRLQARYEATAKGKATKARYRASAKGRATEAALNARKNTRRIFIGRRYVCLAHSHREADAINAHTKERLLGFKQRFKDRAKAEGIPAGAVPSETGPSEDRLGGRHPHA